MRDLLLEIDPSLGRRVGLEQALRNAIRSGRLSAGSTMPSTRTLAADQGLSRSTVLAAYEQLAIEGYLIVRQGSSTTVAELPAGQSPTRRGDDNSRPAAGWTGIGRATSAASGQIHRSIDFRPGEPDSSLFPRSAWLRSARRTLTDTEDELFGYGDPLGHGLLRRQLAEYLGRSRAVSATPDLISIFGGATASAGFIGEVLIRRRIDRVAMEDPGSFLIRQAFELVGVDVVPIPMDEQGLRVDLLEDAAVGAVVVTPANQYPTGVTMSADRRNELLRWARDNRAWIVEDDYDGEFRYDRQTIGALQGLDADRVIYLGTVSKALAPGLRLSWLVVPSELVPDLALAKHLRGAPSSIEQVTLADFIGSGELDRHLRHVRKVYDRRHRVIHRELSVGAPWLRLPSIAAGLHLAATLDGAPMSESQLIDAASRASIKLLGFGIHWAAEPAGEGIVFGFSRLAEHGFGEGVERLRSFLSTLGSGEGD